MCPRRAVPQTPNGRLPDVLDKPCNSFLIKFLGDPPPLNFHRVILLQKTEGGRGDHGYSLALPTSDFCSFVFNRFHALPFYVCLKSFVCNSCENCRGVGSFFPIWNSPLFRFYTKREACLLRSWIETRRSRRISSLLRCHRFSGAFLESMDGIHLQVFKMLSESAGPAHLDPLDLGGGSEAEVDAHVAIGNVAGSAAHFVDQRARTGFHHDFRANPVAIRFGSRRRGRKRRSDHAKCDPMIPVAHIVHQQ